MNETQWKARLRRDLDKIGVALSLHGHMMQAPGWPDLYVASKHWSGWIELKAFKGELSEAQVLVGRKLEGACVFVAMRANGDWTAVRLETASGSRWSEWLPLRSLPDLISVLKAIASFVLEVPL